MNRLAAFLLGALLAAAVTAAPAPRPKTTAPPPKPLDPVKHFYSSVRNGGTFDQSEAVIRVRSTQGGRLLGLTVERKDKNTGKATAVYNARQGEVLAGKDGKSLLIRLRYGKGYDLAEDSRCIFEERTIELPVFAPVPSKKE
jgi:hypothetical protein